MAQGESRGGGYDKAIDEKAKKALGSQSRQSVGAQANARVPGAAPVAPSSLGELMTPSTFGREGPPVDETDLAQRQERNKGFLKNPETMAALTQFGIAMLQGKNPGSAISAAIQAPYKMKVAQAKLDKMAKDQAQEDERIDMERQRLAITVGNEQEKDDQKKHRKEVFGALKTMSDDELLGIAQEMSASGDDEGARIALSMRKAANPDATGILAQYDLAVKQGFKGDLIAFKNATDGANTMEMIRTKMATGVPLSPGEQQVYDDAINADPVMKALRIANPALFGGATPPVNNAVPDATATPSATPGDEGLTEETIQYNMTKYNKTRQEVIDAYNARKANAS